MRLTYLMILNGWVPVDNDSMLWFHESNTDEIVSVWEAAERMGIAIPHLWDLKTCACKFCGMTQHRVYIGGEPMRCMGVPDVKAFQDSADSEKLRQRIERAINGEDGMLWDSSE